MPELRTILVTSRVTFVPENYCQLVRGLANSPHVVGCIVIDNAHWKIALQGFALLVTGAAPKMGLQLLRNLFFDGMKFKRAAYLEKNKKFFLVKDLNSEHALGILQQENIDVVLNARTRTFFKKKLLASPRLGCINIHHGLLPDQRGLMCDFWAHLDGTPAGFSIHQMTSKLDDGAILKVVPVVTDQKDYMTSILLASQMEVRAAEEALDSIAVAQAITGTENLKTENTLYRRNPGIFDFYKLRKKGTRI